MDKKPPFVAPVNVDFEPVSAFMVDDAPTLYYLLETLIDEKRPFFCNPEADPGTGWTVVAGAAPRTLIN